MPKKPQIHNHAVLYRNYIEVLRKYGELASQLPRKFLVSEANTVGYTQSTAYRIIYNITRDNEYRKRIENYEKQNRLRCDEDRKQEACQ